MTAKVDELAATAKQAMTMPGGHARRHRLRLVIPSAVVGAWVLATIVGPPLLGFSPTHSDLVARLQAPSGTHLLGTDEFGRDNLTRLLVGGRVSLEIGITVTLASAIVGTAIGMTAGYVRSVRGLLMRITDGVMAFPAVVLAIAVIAIVGAGQWQIAGVLAIVYTPLFVRISYGETLSLSKRRFIEAATLIGASPWRIIRRHVFPNISAAIIVQATYVFATSILTASALSFLGAGVQPPMPSLGGMINDGYQLITVAWWLSVFPGIALAILVLSLSLAGDALSDVFGRGLGRGAE